MSRYRRILYVVGCPLLVLLIIMGITLVDVNEHNISVNSNNSNDKMIYEGDILGIICDKFCNKGLGCLLNYTLSINYEISSREYTELYHLIIDDDNCSNEYLGKDVWVTVDPVKHYIITNISFISENYFLFRWLGPVLITCGLLLLIIIIIVSLKVVLRRNNSLKYVKRNNIDYTEL